MMKNKNIFKGAALAMLMLFASSCEKHFLDVNENPNNPSSASVDLVLPTAIGYSAYTFGNQYQIIGGLFSQYWTQGPTASQYKEIDAYNVNATESDRPWQQLYSGALADLKYVVDEATAQGKNNYAAIGKIMMAYDFQYLTDVYGKIPFSEALMGEQGTTAPRYDEQEDVYAGILKMVQDGLNLIDESSDVVPGSDDLIFGGDMYMWRKFGNTLKLKILLRQVRPREAMVHDSIAAMSGRGDEFLDMGESAVMQFTTTQFNTNPLYSAIIALNNVPNLLASQTAIQFYQNTNDPRIDVFYDPNASGTQVGIEQGAGPELPGQQSPTSYSSPSENVSGPATPVVFISAAESKFLQAEAAARGYLTGGDAEALYTEGVESSFDFWGLSTDDADSLLAQSSVKFPSGGSTEDKVKAIITQKWASMNGTQGLEAWIEFRRTGYPAFLQPSTSSVLAPGQFPQRLPYPSVETTRNNNVPTSNVGITDKVWWAK